MAAKKKPVAKAPAIDIHQHALLVSLSVSLWYGNKMARDAAHDVMTNSKAEAGTLSAYKKLLPKAALEKHKELRNKAFAVLNQHSLPWRNDGQRIILNTALVKFEEEMRSIKQEWDVATREFVTQYPKHRAAAPKRLGTLFRESDFPDPRTVERKFGLHTSIVPVPRGEDFRVELSETHVKRIRQEIETDVRAALDVAMKDVWYRMHAVVAKMVKKLQSADSIFRDSLVSNIDEIIELIPTLNVTQDAQVKTFAARMKKELTRYSADALRTDDAIRAEVAGNAQAILDKMGDFL